MQFAVRTGRRDPVDLDDLLAAHVPGTTLPQAFYVDPDVFQEDLERIFLRSWLFAGHSCEVAEPGDFFTFAIGDESLIVVRDQAGTVHAHFNVCRHRGSRLTYEACGQARALVCPYHQWAYALDGRLAGTRLMGAGFDKDAYPLGSAHVRELAGLLFVCLATDPPPFEPAAAAIAPQLLPHGLDRGRVLTRHSFVVEANWKVLVENNRECYHCRVTHPEFSTANYDLGLDGDGRADDAHRALLEAAYGRWRGMGLAPREVSFPGGSWYRVSRLPLREGFRTETLDGELAAPVLGRLGELDDPWPGSLRIIGLPNLWAHVNCDHAVTTRLLPLAPGRTQVDVCFLVHGDPADCDADRLTRVSLATFEQDRALCEATYAGIRSRAYRPGPLSPVVENSVDSFLRWYLSSLR